MKPFRVYGGEVQDLGLRVEAFPDSPGALGFGVEVGEVERARTIICPENPTASLF